MPEANRVFALEQARIDEILDARAAELPPGARPAAAHLLASEQLRLRALLTLFAGQAAGCPDDSLYTLGAAVELVHLAARMHRETPVAGSGQPAARAAAASTPPDHLILAGDAMLAKALRMFASLGDSRLISCISEAMLGTFAAGIAEIGALRNAHLPLQGYLAIVTDKTARLTGASCELGALRAGASPEIRGAAAAFGSSLGMVLQLSRDARDYLPSAERKDPVETGLREGKITAPLIFYLASLSPAEAGPLQKRLAGASLTPQDEDDLISAVHERGFAEKAGELALTYADEAEKALERFPESEAREALSRLLGSAITGA